MKQTDKKGRKNEIGAIGERIGVNFLKSKGFWVLEVNYLKKWGEIDIVARGTNKIKFVEVKTVSYETKNDLNEAISRGTWRPEENVHFTKLRKLSRAIESWIAENKYTGDWEIDVISIRTVSREKYATIKHIENVILDDLQ